MEVCFRFSNQNSARNISSLSGQFCPWNSPEFRLKTSGNFPHTWSFSSFFLPSSSCAISYSICIASRLFSTVCSGNKSFIYCSKIPRPTLKLQRRRNFDFCATSKPFSTWTCWTHWRAMLVHCKILLRTCTACVYNEYSLSGWESSVSVTSACQHNWPQLQDIHSVDM